VLSDALVEAPELLVSWELPVGPPVDVDVLADVVLAPPELPEPPVGADVLPEAPVELDVVLVELLLPAVVVLLAALEEALLGRELPVFELKAPLLSVEPVSTGSELFELVHVARDRQDSEVKREAARSVFLWVIELGHWWGIAERSVGRQKVLDAMMPTQLQLRTFPSVGIWDHD
jgi:hypothetical protein